ncbi:hypothetical protein N7495_007864 [Penicillium taxi]|uniref:uncharacterized protein n=1 Tax=Penicillium taxi TaxID=168475 RepID=UPI002544EAF0|nr:uncharacterized protein N7495_007864 [Penicillium taxi]KAJ5887823.1 hypothetical protein N7495_007864 [Penicillium taxi]
MRSFIASFLIAGTAAIATVDDFTSCAYTYNNSQDKALTSRQTATLKVVGCEASDAACFCSKVNSINQLSDTAAAACGAAGLDVKDLETALCSTTSRVAAPFRHASKPMELASVNVKRAYAPESGDIAMDRVVYVTATHTEYACASTPVAEMPNASSPVGSHSHVAMMGASSPTPVWSESAAPSSWSESAAPSSWSESAAPSSWSESAAPSSWSESAAPSSWSESAAPSSWSESSPAASNSRVAMIGASSPTPVWSESAAAPSSWSDSAAPSSWSDSATPSSWSDSAAPSSWSASPSAPAWSHGLMGTPSASVRFAPKLSAYPTPSGASANRFNTFKGAAPQVSAAYSGVVAVGVAAVMGLMIVW